MTVIIPHQSDELKLINLQEKLLSSLEKSNLFSKDTPFYEVNPLWIFLNDDEFLINDKNKLKNTSKKINKITVNSLQYDNLSIYLDATINTNNKEYKEKLTLLKLYIKDRTSLCIEAKKINDEIKKLAENFSFPLALKIFRMGLYECPTDNSYSIKEEVWVKLK